MRQIVPVNYLILVKGILWFLGWFTISRSLMFMQVLKNILLLTFTFYIKANLFLATKIAFLVEKPT